MNLRDVETIEGWVPINRYCAVTGESRNIVHVRVSTGIWQRGKHTAAPDGGTTWVHIPSVLEWIEAGRKQPLRVEGAVSIHHNLNNQAAGSAGVAGEAEGTKPTRL